MAQQPSEGHGGGRNGRLIGVQRLTTTGNYTPTAGTKSILVEAVASGGGGGGGDGGPATAGMGCGGGAGAYALHRWTAVGAGPYAYTIGAIGTGGAAGNNAGTAGSALTFALDVTLNLGGGQGGVSQATGTTLTNLVGANGGVVTVGGNILSQSGEPGGPQYRDSGTLGHSGYGGSSPLGAGGAMKVASAAGATATGDGSGGSGGYADTATDRAGGDGTKGVIIVYEYDA